MFVRSGIRQSCVSRRRLLWLGTLPVVLCALALLSFSGATRAAAPPVNVFPIPGAQVASPQTQIAFRGIPPSQIGSISVTGSRSGAHGGGVQPDSDGRGGSFLPTTPFTPGEVVTVQTSLNITG